MTDEPSEFETVEVVYPLGFCLTVPKGASLEQIAEHWSDMAWQWASDGSNQPALDALQITRLDDPNSPS